MNEAIIDFMKHNIDGGEFRHIHAVGKLCDTAEMIGRLKHICGIDQLPPGIEIREYIEDMQSVMEAADVVLCRAGGSTIAELTAMGKPAVLIPSPYVANNEQEKNALQLQKVGGVVVLDEKDCTGEMLFNTVSAILKDEDRLAGMSAAQKTLGAPEAAADIAELIISLAGEFGIRNEE